MPPGDVTHVPGLICYQCARSGPKISLDRISRAHAVAPAGRLQQPATVRQARWRRLFFHDES